MKREENKTGDLQGQLFVFPGRILFVGLGLHTDFHAHHASSLLLSLEESQTFGLMLEEDGPEHRHSGVILGPGLRHRLMGDSTTMLVLQVVPEMYRFPMEALHVMDQRELDSLRSVISGLEGEGCEEASHRFFQMIALFEANTDSNPEAEVDPRISASLQHIHDSLPEILSVAELAIGAGLSEHRFMHLFKKQVGIPVRRYALWARMQKAAFMLKDGRTLTEAAHEAGFSDSAHMSRSFKELFGISPSAVFGERASVMAHFCNQVWNQERRS